MGSKHMDMMPLCTQLQGCIDCQPLCSAWSRSKNHCELRLCNISLNTACSSAFTSWNKLSTSNLRIQNQVTVPLGSLFTVTQHQNSIFLFICIQRWSTFFIANPAVYNIYQRDCRYKSFKMWGRQPDRLCISPRWTYPTQQLRVQCRFLLTLYVTFLVHDNDKLPSLAHNVRRIE